MRIAGFIKTSLLDWDGHVVSSLYLPGCNYRCPYCHNPDLVLRPDEQDEVQWDEVEEYLDRNKDFLDGVVVTGGEPTVHSDLRGLLSRIKDAGLKVKLDTNGSRPDALEDLLDAALIDYVAMDVKAPLNEKYALAAGEGADVEAVKRSIELIRASGVDHEFRVTVAPHILTAEDVEAIAAYLGGARKLAIQQFRPGMTLDPAMSAASPLPSSEILAMAEAAKRYVRQVVVRGDV